MAKLLCARKAQHKLQAEGAACHWEEGENSWIFIHTDKITT
ncbi:hypothetical protein F945_00509 [Acinetobacter rudis CIP 110305]|uniref:Uncharacterized protein n=1 Tax=Acinetobacter rudis CIP 110305 TaxID=421052 RepID=S3PNK2_9GAMM|nr:hypothetical protein F945_00509 [Acinetobacter rudis CIP 110305]